MQDFCGSESRLRLPRPLPHLKLAWHEDEPCLILLAANIECLHSWRLSHLPVRKVKTYASFCNSQQQPFPLSNLLCQLQVTAFQSLANNSRNQQHVAQNSQHILSILRSGTHRWSNIICQDEELASTLIVPSQAFHRRMQKCVGTLQTEPLRAY